MYSREFTSTFHDVHPRYVNDNCEQFTALEMPDTHYCWIEVKNAVVMTPMVDFEIAMVHAMDFIGMRTKMLGLTTPLLTDKSMPDMEKKT